MDGFPASAWVLLVVAIVPGMALAIWNAARGRRGFGAPASGPHRRAARGETHATDGPEAR
jgi:hypothetical protein